MNWKKWDDSTWVNMSNGHTIELNRKDSYVCYRVPKQEDNNLIKYFKSVSEAVAFIEELIK